MFISPEIPHDEPNYKLDLFAYQQWRHSEEESFEPPREFIYEALSIAINEELSPIERECFLARYRDGMTMEKIARTRGVNTATVSRNIKRSKAKLLRVLKYTSPRLLRMNKRGLGGNEYGKELSGKKG